MQTVTADSVALPEAEVDTPQEVLAVAASELTASGGQVSQALLLSCCWATPPACSAASRKSD